MDYQIEIIQARKEHTGINEQVRNLLYLEETDLLKYFNDLRVK